LLADQPHQASKLTTISLIENHPPLVLPPHHPLIPSLDQLSNFLVAPKQQSVQFAKADV